MDRPDVNALAQKMIEAVQGFVAQSENALCQRIQEVEAKISSIPSGPKGEKGDPGESIRGERGDPGERGESVKGDKGDQGEPGVAGKDGRDGIDGKDGPPGPPGESIKGDLGPVGERGPKGENGAQGEPGTVGPRGEKGLDGAPGRDGRDGLPGLNGKDGAPGANGSDGFSLEDFDMVLAEDGRTLSLKFKRGDLVVERAIRLATMIYREVWREGEYELGDVVTWGGSAWHCQQKTADKPGTSSAWKLMVKEGARGKDAKSAHEEVVARIASAQPVRLK
jgi:hypothetical protein